MKFYCNPMNLEYKYQYTFPAEGDLCTVYREAADPSLIMFKGKYYLFVSMSLGFWTSDDLLNWEYHAFKQEMRVSITQYITRIRIEQAQRLLNESDLKVGEIAGRVGLSDPRYFNTVFKRQVGMTPSEYRERRS